MIRLLLIWIELLVLILQKLVMNRSYTRWNTLIVLDLGILVLDQDILGDLVLLLLLKLLDYVIVLGGRVIRIQRHALSSSDMVSSIDLHIDISLVLISIIYDLRDIILVLINILRLVPILRVQHLILRIRYKALNLLRLDRGGHLVRIIWNFLVIYDISHIEMVEVLVLKSLELILNQVLRLLYHQLWLHYLL